MHGFQVLGHGSRVGQFAVGLFGVADGKCLDGLAPDFGHQRRHGAGVEAAAQEYAERNIAHQMAVDRSFEQVAITFNIVAFVVQFVFGEQRQVPVLLDAQLALLVDFQTVSRHQLIHAGVESLLAGEIPKARIFRKRGTIEFGPHLPDRPSEL